MNNNLNLSPLKRLGEIITVAASKGGVGKTTTATTLARELGARGKRVLLIDMDSQCNTTWLYSNAQTRQSKRALYEAIMAPNAVSIVDCIVPVANSDKVGKARGNVYLVPSRDDPQEIGLMYNKLESSKYQGLKELLTPCRQLFHHIIIDSPPTIGAFLYSGLFAATKVIAPIVPSSLDYSSFVQSLKVIKNVGTVKKKTKEPFAVAGILPTKYDGRRSADRAFVAGMQKKYGELVLSPIRQCQDVVNAQAHKLVVTEYNHQATAAQDYYQVSLRI